MNFRKLKFNNHKSHTIQNEEILLCELLNKIPSKADQTHTIFEESMSFYGEWETSLYFFEFSSGDILHFEDIAQNNTKIFKEYNSDEFYKSYKFLSFDNRELSPIYSFFQYDNENNIYTNAFVYDMGNELLNLDFFSGFPLFSVPDLESKSNVVEQHIDIHKYNSYPFLFIKK